MDYNKSFLSNLDSITCKIYRSVTSKFHFCTKRNSQHLFRALVLRNAVVIKLNTRIQANLVKTKNCSELVFMQRNLEINKRNIELSP